MLCLGAGSGVRRPKVRGGLRRGKWKTECLHSRAKPHSMQRGGGGLALGRPASAASAVSGTGKLGVRCLPSSKDAVEHMELGTVERVKGGM